MTMNLHSRVERLESANKPQAGELPVLVVMPRDATSDERAAIRADVASREAAGQLVLLISTSENPLERLVEHFI